MKHIEEGGLSERLETKLVEQVTYGEPYLIGPVNKLGIIEKQKIEECNVEMCIYQKKKKEGKRKERPVVHENIYLCHTNIHTRITHGIHLAHLLLLLSRTERLEWGMEIWSGLQLACTTW